MERVGSIHAAVAGRIFRNIAEYSFGHALDAVELAACSMQCLY